MEGHLEDLHTHKSVCVLFSYPNSASGLCMSEDAEEGKGSHSGGMLRCPGNID